MIFWRYLAPSFAEEHTLPPHQQIDKQMPSRRRRSERSEGSGGGTKAQTSEKSLSQPSHPCMIRRSDDREPEKVKLLPRPSWRDSPSTGNSKQAHKTTTIPPHQQQTTTNPFTQITISGDSEDNRRSEDNVKELLLHALKWTTLPPQQQQTNTCKGRPKARP